MIKCVGWKWAGLVMALLLLSGALSMADDQVSPRQDTHIQWVPVTEPVDELITLLEWWDDYGEHWDGDSTQSDFLGWEEALSQEYYASAKR